MAKSGKVDSLGPMARQVVVAATCPAHRDPPSRTSYIMPIAMRADCGKILISGRKRSKQRSLKTLFGGKVVSEAETRTSQTEIKCRAIDEPI